MARVIPRPLAWLMSGAVAVVACALGSCATPKTEFRPALLEGGRGVIYMFRASDMVGGGAVDLVLNQEPIGALQPGEYPRQGSAAG